LLGIHFDYQQNATPARNQYRTISAFRRVGFLATPPTPAESLVAGSRCCNPQRMLPANNVTYFARWAAKLVSTTSTYTYRADGLRHSKTVNGVTTYHVWDRGNIVLELNAAGAVINRFERGARGQLIRSQHHGFYLHDARGSVVQRVDMNGNVLRNYWYTAFGIEFFPNFTNSNPFQFNSMYWDAHTQTYYTPNRHLNPRTGRFTQPDPHWTIHNSIFGDSPTMMNSRYVPSIHAILQSGNLYMFTMHNPVRWTDPTGLFAVDPALAITCPVAVITLFKKVAPHIQTGSKWLWGYAKQGLSWAGDRLSQAGNWIRDGATRVFSSGGGQVAANGIHIFAKGIKDGTIGKGFQTFSQAKSYLGAAAPGHHWHHVVEQSQIVKSGFDRLIIHNTHNLVQLPTAVHHKITGFYASKAIGVVDTGGLKFRDWLVGQSFEVQYEWGIFLINYFGGK